MDMYQKREQRKKDKAKDKNNTENNGKININWYPGHMAKTKRLISETINLIDVVYEVIDARMPFSSKLKDIDNYINDKPRVIIMTKIDLCDMAETKKWIKFYENKGYKVVPMDLNKNFNMNTIINATNDLMKEKNDKRLAKGMSVRKTRILVVGIPNAGKSTLINRLVNKKAVKVGNKPGVTKTLDWIRINNNLELLDTPGILWPKLDNEKIAFNLASLTAIKEEILPLDEVAVYILKTLYNYYPKVLEARYGMKEIDFDDILTTFDIIGKKRGCLIKGGTVDYDKVITVIINDIKEGNIKGITFDRFEDVNE